MRTSVDAWGTVNSRMPVGMHEWSTLLPSGTCPEARPQRTLFLGIDMHTSVEAWGRDSSRMPVGMHEWSTLLPSATDSASLGAKLFLILEARKGCPSRQPAFLAIPINILVIHNGRTQRGQISSFWFFTKPYLRGAVGCYSQRMLA